MRYDARSDVKREDDKKGIRSGSTEGLSQELQTSSSYNDFNPQGFQPPDRGNQIHYERYCRSYSKHFEARPRLRSRRLSEESRLVIGNLDCQVDTRPWHGDQTKVWLESICCRSCSLFSRRSVDKPYRVTCILPIVPCSSPNKETQSLTTGEQRLRLRNKGARQRVGSECYDIILVIFAA